MKFKSITQLLDHFRDEETCIKYYEKLRWYGYPYCPHCLGRKPYKTNRGYKCSVCLKKFTVKVGTIFENSKIPFRTWFAALYLCSTHKKGISTVQLATDLNITQKTAWFMLHRIREMMKAQAPDKLGGNDVLVEADETYVGGVEGNRHRSKRLASPETGLANDGTRYNEKKVVLGIIERNGRVILKYIPNAKAKNMLPVIEHHIPKGAKIYTDTFSTFQSLGKRYDHKTINHSLSIYVDGDIHTNTIESFWSLLKRGLYGIYHQVSHKHIDRYLSEFAARFNSRNLDSCQRFEEFLSKSNGSLLYKNLIADE